MFATHFEEHPKNPNTLRTDGWIERGLEKWQQVTEQTGQNLGGASLGVCYTNFSVYFHNKMGDP